MSDSKASGSEQPDTLLRQKGIQMRMRCKPNAAHRIENAFVTLERLVEAVESDTVLTEYEGVGPKTAEIIENWWEERFKREEKASSSTTERTGRRSASIFFHNSWEGAIAGGNKNTDSDREEVNIEP